MDKMLQTLSEGLPMLELQLEESIQKKLCDFGHAMVKQNEVMNLTGITEDSAVAKLHLLDSLTVLSSASLSGKSLIESGITAECQNAVCILLADALQNCRTCFFVRLQTVDAG